jgi:hypothetical protein
MSELREEHQTDQVPAAVQFHPADDQGMASHFRAELKRAIGGAFHGAGFFAIYLLLRGLRLRVWSEGSWLFVVYGALVGAVTALIAGPIVGMARRCAIGASVMTALTLGLAVSTMESDRLNQLCGGWVVLYLALIGGLLGTLQAGKAKPR